METETSVLRRKLNSVRQENTSLVMENRQLISDLEAAQLELASSRSKVILIDERSVMAAYFAKILKMQCYYEWHTTPNLHCKLKMLSQKIISALLNREDIAYCFSK